MDSLLFVVSMSEEHAYVGRVVLQGAPQQLVASILKILTIVI
jgi:hypothetical protein